MRVLEVIKDLSADIVILQEADRRLGARPSAIPMGRITAQTGLRALSVAANDVSLGWHGNAVLVADAVTMQDVQLLDLPGLEPRGAAILDLHLHGQDFRLVATHLGLMRRYRHQQLRHILDALATLPPCPTLIAGDFNEWSDHKGFEILDQDFDILSPGRSYHASRPIAALDKIAYSNDWQVLEGGVVQHGLARIASDHLPIWAQLAVTATLAD